MVRTALERPHGIPRLREIARHVHDALIVTCDKTRGMPSHITLPYVLEELEAGGLHRDTIRVLIATGLHKGETRDDVRERLGSELVEDLEVRVHDSDDQEGLMFLGALESGTPLFLNKSVVESDLVIIESTVEPHFFAGFTGGSKVILPGVAGTETVLQNHRWQNVDDSRSRYGVLENPVRADANAALRFIKRAFSLNVVLDDQKRITYANSGDVVTSFNIVADIVTEHSRVLVETRPDLVITTNGGYPLDRNLYQCVKGIAVPEQIVHPSSRIIMVGECADGVAHDEFRSLVTGRSPKETYEKLKSSDVTVRDQWEAQVLCRVLSQNPVWFVTRSALSSEIESMHMHYASTVEEALDSAGLSKEDEVLIVPQGPSTILNVR